MRTYKTKSEKLWQLLDELGTKATGLSVAELRRAYESKHNETISDSLICRINKEREINARYISAGGKNNERFQ